MEEQEHSEQTVPQSFQFDFANYELIAQGAEGRLFKGVFLGKPVLVKERVRKAYRHPILDANIRNKRLVQEARSMARCLKAGIKTPLIRYVDVNRYCIIMDYIEGCTFRDFINKKYYHSEEELNTYCFKLGQVVAQLHNHNFIHGDLTTSNFLVEAATGDLVLIDFGLTVVSSSAEDMGVDLYVLERAFISTHVAAKDLFSRVMEGYESTIVHKKENINAFNKVRARGRKRIAFG
ncbi:hypothetical protein BLSTO_00640 [Blastocystis sp. subtype 1]